MVNKSEQAAAERFGLVGLGVTRRWDVALDEALDGEGWALEIDGPQAYLVFQVQDLSVLPAALNYLQSASSARKPADEAGRDDGLVIGRFGSSPVSLMWDDEEPPRCFLIVGPETHCTLRLSFDGEDIRMLVAALQQIAAEIPKPSCDDANGAARR